MFRNGEVKKVILSPDHGISSSLSDIVNSHRIGQVYSILYENEQVCLVNSQGIIDFKKVAVTNTDYVLDFRDYEKLVVQVQVKKVLHGFCIP